jgi:hypothetical protein
VTIGRIGAIPLRQERFLEEVAAVIGSFQQKQSVLGHDHRVFTTEDFSLTIQRLRRQKPEDLQMMLALAKNRTRPGDVVKDDPDAPGTHAGLLLVRLAHPGREAKLAGIAVLFATEAVEAWRGCLVVATDEPEALPGQYLSR